MCDPCCDVYSLSRVAFESLDSYLHPSPLLVVVSGPSGVGKDSVVRRMIELHYSFHFVVTVTSRPPRQGEVHGVDYTFVSEAEFERMIAEDELFEHARVYDQYKGIPKAQVRQALASGQDVLLRLDVQGAATMRAKAPDAVTIFLAPPSMDVLVARLRRRGSDSPAELAQRLRTAEREMGALPSFDYVVFNHEDALDEAARQIGAIMASEKCRVGRRSVVV